MPDAPPNCHAMMPWCASAALLPDPIAYPSADHGCYCMCDPNKSNADCASAPLQPVTNAPAECGVMFDVVMVGGVPTKQERFPTTSFVCRWTEYQQAQ